jgi:hypothetical protein
LALYAECQCHAICCPCHFGRVKSVPLSWAFQCLRAWSIAFGDGKEVSFLFTIN